jgi:isochorismate pyruvate lyase
MSPPDACPTLEEVRAEIARLDHKIVAILGMRFSYVRAAAAFKTSAAGLRAPERMASMLQQRRAWALDAGLCPDVIERLFSDLIEYFTAEEVPHWQSSHDGP